MGVFGCRRSSSLERNGGGGGINRKSFDQWCKKTKSVWSAKLGPNNILRLSDMAHVRPVA